jgi:succinate dehydrogenase flavin-adding protein (antitoxin of CptAB toxin-antitoxin module)
MADKPKPRKRFIIMVEGMAPVKVKFQTFAEDENEALKQLDNTHLISMLERPEIDMPRLIRKKVTVKDANTSLVKIVKNF